MFSLTLLIAVLAATVHAQDGVTGTFPATPLYSKTGFVYPSQIPYKVDTDTGLIRGEQFGYNICNSTTENQQSNCQTSFLNSIDDFCLWGPPEPNSTVADLEGEMVAWCTKPGRGTRLIPDGALQGVQFIKTKDYILVAGFIDQTMIDLQPNDFGGEMDPHGADLRGNPMGGIMFSTNFTGGQFLLTRDWTNFIGNGGFCFKVCDPSGPNAPEYCRNTLDRLGCAYNAPNNAQNGTFEECLGDSGPFPGVYTSNGVTITYSQPPESLGPITSVPYTPTVPPSSNCITHASTDLFTALPRPTNLPSSSGVVTVLSTGSDGSVTTSTRSGAPAPANTNSPNGASSLAISCISILGVVFATILLS